MIQLTQIYTLLSAISPTHWAPRVSLPSPNIECSSTPSNIRIANAHQRLAISEYSMHINAFQYLNIHCSWTPSNIWISMQYSPTPSNIRVCNVHQILPISKYPMLNRPFQNPNTRHANQTLPSLLSNTYQTHSHVCFIWKYEWAKGGIRTFRTCRAVENV